MYREPARETFKLPCLEQQGINGNCTSNPKQRGAVSTSLGQHIVHFDRSIRSNRHTSELDVLLRKADTYERAVKQLLLAHSVRPQCSRVPSSSQGTIHGHHDAPLIQLPPVGLVDYPEDSAEDHDCLAKPSALTKKSQTRHQGPDVRSSLVSNWMHSQSLQPWPLLHDDDDQANYSHLRSSALVPSKRRRVVDDQVTCLEEINLPFLKREECDYPPCGANLANAKINSTEHNGSENELSEHMCATITRDGRETVDEPSTTMTTENIRASPAKVCDSASYPPPKAHSRWSRSDDEILRAEVHAQQERGVAPLQWSRIAQKIGHQNGAQCQVRWVEALDESIRKGRWTRAEDELLREGLVRYGSAWSKIARVVSTRTQRQCRSRWLQINDTSTKYSTSTCTSNKHKV